MCGLALVVSGCFGGQTGESGNASCGETKVLPDQRVGSTSPAEFARAFAGAYTSPMRWSTQSAVADIASANSVATDDAITVVITYAGGEGTSSCDYFEGVDVVIDVTNRNGGVHEHGNGVLRPDGTGAAQVVFEGKQLRLDARVVAAPVMSLSGHVDALVPDLPGSVGTFPPPSAPANGSGGMKGVP